MQVKLSLSPADKVTLHRNSLVLFSVFRNLSWGQGDWHSSSSNQSPLAAVTAVQSTAALPGFISLIHFYVCMTVGLMLKSTAPALSLLFIHRPNGTKLYIYALMRKNMFLNISHLVSSDWKSPESSFHINRLHTYIFNYQRSDINDNRFYTWQPERPEFLGSYNQTTLSFVQAGCLMAW